MIIHLASLKNVNNPGVLLFPKLLICLDCGFWGYKVPASELPLLERGSSKSECSTGEAAFSELTGPETVSNAIPN
jgi:hypothetical protein